MAKGKNIVCVSGNCTTGVISELLKTNKDFVKGFEIKSLTPIFMINEGNVDEYLNTVKQCDIYITQSIVGERYKNFGIDTESIKTLLGAQADVFMIPVPYFTGYFPEQFYLHDENGIAVQPCEGLPSPYHNKIILWGYINKIAEENLLEIMYKDVCMNGILQNVCENINELKRREVDMSFGISEYIEENYKKERLFWTLNHPTNSLLVYMSKEILKLLGIKKHIFSKMINYRGGELLGGYATPILPSVKKDLDLKFNTANYLYTFDIIRATYNYYDNHRNLVELNKHLVKDII